MILFKQTEFLIIENKIIKETPKVFINLMTINNNKIYNKKIIIIKIIIMKIIFFKIKEIILINLSLKLTTNPY